MKAAELRSTSLAHWRKYVAALILVAFASLLIAGCEGGSDEYAIIDPPGMPGAPGDPGMPGIPGKPVLIEKAVEVQGEAMMEFDASSDDGKYEVISTVTVEGPATEVMVEAEFVEEAEAMEAASTGESVGISFQPQTRIIVRNADMAVEADDPMALVDAIGNQAQSRGGWIVSSISSSENYHYITVRVPAETLDEVIEYISAMASKVQSVQSDSTDFTEEYIDLDARRKTIEETIEALTALLRNERYDSVEELLAVQREITNWQSDLERIDGRMSFISESAAFSRLSVSVNQAPIPLRVDAGEDVFVGLDIAKQYTARFYPSEDFENYEITWNFGDGSGNRTVHSALLTPDEEGLLSVPVLHTYRDEDYSPYVVEVKVRAFSDNGIAEGEDRFWAHVSELPRLDVYISPDGNDVEEKQPITFTVTFNHHERVRDLQYQWDFRDGSPVVTGTVPYGDTGFETTHTFDRFRPAPYEVQFEIWGDSDVGEVRETYQVYVYVYPGPTVESSNFDPAETFTDGLNVLIQSFTFIGTALIWFGVTLPIWILIAAVVYVLIRLYRRRGWRRKQAPQVTDADHNAEEAAN